MNDDSSGRFAPQPGQPERGLRFFLDSADPEDWRRFLPLGIFYGVTTNPLLLERAGRPCTVADLRDLVLTARDLHASEIHLQTWGINSERMIETGEKLAELDEPDLRVVIKLPATAEGFQAARTLRQLGRQVTMTAVFNPGQVMAAAGLGANYAAPYLGRLDDAGHDGAGIILTMHHILTRTGSRTRLLTASLRNAEQVVDLAAKGLDTFTLGIRVAEQLLASDLTDAAAADFQRAAQTRGEIS